MTSLWANGIQGMVSLEALRINVTERKTENRIFESATKISQERKTHLVQLFKDSNENTYRQNRIFQYHTCYKFQERLSQHLRLISYHVSHTLRINSLMKLIHPFSPFCSQLPCMFLFFFNIALSLIHVHKQIE